MDPKESIVVAYTAQQYTKCLALLETSPSEVSQLTDMRILHASCLINISGRTSDAHQILDKILESETDNGLAFYGKGLAFLKEGNLQESFENFNRAAELDKTGVISKAQVMKLRTEKMLEKQRKSRRISVSRQSYTCDTCHKSFAQSFSLNRHKLIHTGERPHKCQLCDFGFVQKSDLRRHMSVHKDTADYGCDTCGKQFKSKKNLKLHVVTHSIVKPFRCDTCGKDFKYRRLMKMHSIVHSRRKKYSCDFCEKVLVTKPSLKAHLMMHINRRMKAIEKIGENGGEINGGTENGQVIDQGDSNGADAVRKSKRGRKIKAKTEIFLRNMIKKSRNGRKPATKAEKSATNEKMAVLVEEQKKSARNTLNSANSARNTSYSARSAKYTSNSAQNTLNSANLARNIISSANSAHKILNSYQENPNSFNSPLSILNSANSAQNILNSANSAQNVLNSANSAQKTLNSSNSAQNILNSARVLSNPNHEIPFNAKLSLGNIELPSSLQIRPVVPKNYPNGSSPTSLLPIPTISIQKEPTNILPSTHRKPPLDPRISSIFRNPNLSVSITNNEPVDNPDLAIVHEHIKLEPMEVAEDHGMDNEESSNHDSVLSSELDHQNDWNLFFKSLMHDLSKMDDRQKRKFKQQTFVLIDDILQ